MNKIITLISILFIGNLTYSQSFSPAAGQPGSNAISKDSSVFVAWATGIEVNRGFQNIENNASGLATFGSNTNGIGMAEGSSTNVVSLGDGGNAILTFATPIKNGNGPDFAVFENGFADNFLELAFVEVSSDGIHFVRFAAISETPISSQIGPFDYSNCAYLNNLAGNFRQGFGTPFDLNELIDSLNLDVNAITHVKIIDVVGSINPLFGSYDSQGTIINDLYPTDFPSGGFDLDAVGVIHTQTAGLTKLKSLKSIYPNPTKDCIRIVSNKLIHLEAFDIFGSKLFDFGTILNQEICLEQFQTGIILLKLTDEKGEVEIEKISVK